MLREYIAHFLSPPVKVSDKYQEEKRNAMPKLELDQIKQVLKTDPTNWGVGFFDIQIRHQYYVQAAQEIEKLEAQLRSAKTAALLDVAKVMAARGDWKIASEVLAYRGTDLHTLGAIYEEDMSTPVLAVDTIIDDSYNDDVVEFNDPIPTLDQVEDIPLPGPTGPQGPIFKDF